MICRSQNNWHSWSYNDLKETISLSPNDVFKTHYNRSKNKIQSFRNELLNAAKNTLDCYPNLRPCIFFSGGLDSEIVMRSYVNIGANPLAYIFRYENDYNLYDVSYAISICSSMDVEYKLIDFNLKKFYENDAEAISKISQIDRPRALPQLKFLDYVDSGLAIYGIGDPRWSKKNNNNEQISDWVLIDQEHDTGWEKYIIHKNVTAIAQWFKWSPELMLSYTNLQWFQNLINGKFIGKLGVTSTKFLGYKEAYPDLLFRKKQTGFEKIDDLINNFELFLYKKYNGFCFRRTFNRTLDELYLEITGKTYLEFEYSKNLQ